MKVSSEVAALNPGVFGGGRFADAGVTKPRLRQDRKGPNRLEREFEAWLREEFMNARVQIHPQAVTLRLANGVRYTGDVAMWMEPEKHLNDGQLSIWECKGFMRDDASVKIKVAARVYPWIKFHLVTKRRKQAGGGWDIEEVRP